MAHGHVLEKTLPSFYWCYATRAVTKLFNVNIFYIFYLFIFILATNNSAVYNKLQYLISSVGEAIEVFSQKFCAMNTEVLL